MTPLRRISTVAGVVVLALGLLSLKRWRAGEVWVSAAPESLDTSNAPLFVLARAVRANPTAKHIGVKYIVLPDPERPLESMPRTMEWDRPTRVLRWKRELRYESYRGVREDSLNAVAARGGNVGMLLEGGAKRLAPP